MKGFKFLSSKKLDFIFKAKNQNFGFFIGYMMYHFLSLTSELKFIPVIRSVLYTVLTPNFSTFFKISRPGLEFNQYLIE